MPRIDSDRMVHLTDEDVDMNGQIAQLTQNNLPIFIMFMSSGCPHCVSAKPDFAKAMTAAGQYVLYAYVQVDSEDSAERTLAQRFGRTIMPALGFSLTGVPAFFYYNRGKYLQYNGGRTMSDFVNYTLTQLNGGVPPPQAQQQARPQAPPQPQQQAPPQPQRAAISNSAAADLLRQNSCKFYGREWCGYCKKQKAELDAAGINSNEFYVDCGQNEEQCTQLGIKGVPDWRCNNAAQSKSTGYSDIPNVIKRLGL